MHPFSTHPFSIRGWRKGALGTNGLNAKAIFQYQNGLKHPFRGVLWKSCSENMQQMYRRTTTPKCDFNKESNFIEIKFRHGCSPVNLLHIFTTPFPKNTSERLLLNGPKYFSFFIIQNIFDSSIIQ